MLAICLAVEASPDEIMATACRPAAASKDAPTAAAHPAGHCCHHRPRHPVRSQAGRRALYFTSAAVILHFVQLRRVATRPLPAS
ncbi:MAG: hypothetical protein ACLSVD_10025 [Eggerthellaceae bacterium]